jgi:hypothetical protein
MRSSRSRTTHTIALCLWIACHAACGDDAAPSPRGASATSLIRQGAWFIADSPSFQVCSLRSFEEARQTASYCESRRADLLRKWNPKDSANAWQPRCQVVLHNTLQGYVRAVGRGSENTLGSSLVWPGRGIITTRKIDVRAEHALNLDAVLPHELTHLVLADRFGSQTAPLWFDEGVAILADPEPKQQLHQRDLLEGLTAGRAFPLVQFMSMSEYPSADRVAVYYGQCAALARMFLKLGTAEDALRFLETSRDSGVAVALREVYGLKRSDALVSLWQTELGQPDSSKAMATTGSLAPLSAVAPLAALAP